MGVLPARDDLAGDGRHLGALAAHAPDDVLGEAHPDLLVVIELGMPLEVRDRGDPGIRVQLQVELQAVCLGQGPVRLRAELGPRHDEREVDVEENCQRARHGPPRIASPRGRTIGAARARTGVVCLPQPRLPAALVGAHGVADRRRRISHRARLAHDDAHRIGDVARHRAHGQQRRRCSRRCSSAARSPTATRGAG